MSVCACRVCACVCVRVFDIMMVLLSVQCALLTAVSRCATMRRVQAMVCRRCADERRNVRARARARVTRARMMNDGAMAMTMNDSCCCAMLCACAYDDDDVRDECRAGRRDDVRCDRVLMRA